MRHYFLQVFSAKPLHFAVEIKFISLSTFAIRLYFSRLILAALELSFSTVRIDLLRKLAYLCTNHKCLFPEILSKNCFISPDFRNKSTISSQQKCQEFV